MNVNERLKINRKIILVMLILAIASIPVSVLIAYFVGDGLTFSIGGLCSAIWICAIFLVFPIATFVYGIVMAKKGYPARRDIVVGAICMELILDIVFLFPFLSSANYTSYDFCHDLIRDMTSQPLDKKDYKVASFYYAQGVRGDFIFKNEELIEKFNKTTLNAKWNDKMPDGVKESMSKYALEQMKGFDCYYYRYVSSGGYSYQVANYTVKYTGPRSAHELFAYNKTTGHIRYYGQVNYL